MSLASFCNHCTARSAALPKDRAGGSGTTFSAEWRKAIQVGRAGQCKEMLAPVQLADGAGGWVTFIRPHSACKQQVAAGRWLCCCWRSPSPLLSANSCLLPQEVDSSVKKHLRESIAGGFDEERFGTRIGFGNLRRQGRVGEVRGPRKPNVALLMRVCFIWQALQFYHMLSPAAVANGLCPMCLLPQVPGGGAGAAVPRCRTCHPGAAAGLHTLPFCWPACG